MANWFQRAVQTVTSVFRREPAPEPERQPERPREEQRGLFSRLIDRVSGADRRREEQERQAQLDARERELAERERQVEERERQVEERQEREQQPEERDLPKFADGGVSDYLDRDERAFGTDNELVRDLEQAVSDFIADRWGMDGLNADAVEWLENPTISQPFSDYWQSGGFTADQVLEGMTNISNIEIIEDEDGDIHVEFDYDADVDGYEIHGHASS